LVDRISNGVALQSDSSELQRMSTGLLITSPHTGAVKTMLNTSKSLCETRERHQWWSDRRFSDPETVRKNVILNLILNPESQKKRDPEPDPDPDFLWSLGFMPLTSCLKNNKYCISIFRENTWIILILILTR